MNEKEEMREIDRWLRKAAFIGTISSFLIGWGSGVFTTYLFFKNHELRLTMSEMDIKENKRDINYLLQSHQRVLTILKTKMGIDIQ